MAGLWEGKPPTPTIGKSEDGQFGGSGTQPIGKSGGRQVGKNWLINLPTVLAFPPMNWRAMFTKPTEVGCFQSVSTDFVSIAQHFNAGQGRARLYAVPTKIVGAV